MTTLFDYKWRGCWADGMRFCIGFDPDYDKIPQKWKRFGSIKGIFGFNRSLVDETAEYAAAIKPNLGFYLAKGSDGVRALEETFSYCQKHHGGKPMILDCKSGDIGSSAEQYASFVFRHLNADAATLSPLLGLDGAMPFLEYTDRTSFVLCRTSNTGGNEFQNRVVPLTEKEAQDWHLPTGSCLPFYQLVAYRVSREWNRLHGNCGLVVGATFPEELKRVRDIVGDMPILSPGIGKQKGDLKLTVKYGLSGIKPLLAINSGSNIIFDPEPGKKAKELCDEINMELAEL
jgi:orotidine-5'-phosphate decarboxylase